MLIPSCLIIFLNHPLSLGFMILIQSFLTCFILGSLTLNFWYSYILILIMVGGLLILFIYMTSIASNEKFKFNSLLFVTSSLIIFSTMALSVNTPFLMNDLFFKNELILNLNNNYNFYYSMSKFYNFPSLKIMILTIFYLLITMIASVKICKTNKGPLRQMFYENTNPKNFPFN
uniref:NADH-ubiquinone oxidoreductase chain 6 n=1 Tax=Afissula sp. XL-2019 TaxID=2678940 RepID=A0A6B9MXG2_9CUCU|nr:NADH dehydrogenase subunit 6 [Afissula sp. XL-2019]